MCVQKTIFLCLEVYRRVFLYIFGSVKINICMCLEIYLCVCSEVGKTTVYNTAIER